MNWTKKHLSLNSFNNTQQAKYAEGLGIPTNKVAQFYLVNGSLSMIGRILSGFLLDKRCITPRCFYAFTSLIGGVATLLLPLATAHWYLMVVSCVLGWVKGTLTSTTYVIQLQIIADSVPKGRQAQTFGICNFLFYVIASAGPSTAGKKLGSVVGKEILLVFFSITEFTILRQHIPR